jgi:enolase
MDKEIKKIYAREILDSRANPTVEAKVLLKSGHTGVSSVPSGASTGAHEAHELRDGDKSRFMGRGVLRAVDNLNNIISPALSGLDATDQAAVDEAMIRLDGTENKSSLGANAILAVSLATARAASSLSGKEPYEYLCPSGDYKMPTPMFNLLNGGAHAANNIDIQEFMVVPHGLDLPDAIRAGSEIYHTLGRLLRQRGLSTGVGDEGGFAPDLGTDEDAISLLCLSIKESGYSTDKVGIALDVASSEWYKDGKYLLPKRSRIMDRQELIGYYRDLCERYPIISIEDGLAEDDFDGWAELTEALGDRCMLVGDDLFVTNTKRLRHGIDMKIGNAILIKPNQIGTLTEAMKVIGMAKDAGYSYIISHRSGETPDSFIADIAVATGAGYIKSGAPCRGERVAKYNRLLEIYDMLYNNI